MYTESEKREINWGVIVKRAIIAIGIILLVLLLIWMISKINGTNDNNKATYDNQSTTKVENKSLETYSKEFIDNIRYMQDVARNYWLINGTLPTDGNSIEFTLKELISKGLILPFSDKYGNACDLNESYVRLTNNNETYTMSVKLACDTETATISEELGCNQFCDGKCTDVDTKIQYQFKQAYEATTTTYTCPSGYKRNGNKCYKGTNVIIDFDIDKMKVLAIDSSEPVITTEKDWLGHEYTNQEVFLSKKSESNHSLQQVIMLEQDYH